MSKIWYFLVGALLVGCGDDKQVSFDDLSPSEQNRYVLKSEYEALGDYFSWLEVRGNNIQSDVLEIPNEPNLLKHNLEIAIRDNRVLLSDNTQLIRQNLELAKEVESQKIALINADKNAQNNYNEALQSTQVQHQENISELTKRINELQAQSIESIKKYEEKIVNLENNVDELNSKLQKSKIVADEMVKNSAMKEKLENQNLQNSNQKLSDEIAALKAQNLKASSEANSNLSAKEKEINTLKKEITSKNEEINQLMHSQTLALIDLQNQNAKNVSELQAQIDRQRSEYFNELNSKNSEIKKLNLTIKNINDNKEKELKELKKDLQNSYKTTQTASDKKIKEQYEKSLKDQNMTIASLNAKLVNQEINYKKELKNKEKEYKDSIIDLRKKIEFNIRDANKSAQKIDELEKKTASKDKEIERLKSQILSLKSDMNNTKKLANYELLNSKITDLEVKNSELNSQIATIIKKAKDTIEMNKKEHSKEIENQKKYYEELIKNIKTQEINRDNNGSA